MKFPDNDQLKEFDVGACQVGDFVFRTCLPELGLMVRVLKAHSKDKLSLFELPYMEFEASLAQYGRTVIRTWKRIY